MESEMSVVTMFILFSMGAFISIGILDFCMIILLALNFGTYGIQLLID